MRWTTVTPVVLLSSIVLLSAGALAHGVGTAETQQHTATLAGFAPPVVALASGDTVKWTSLDVLHTFTEGGFGPSTGLPRCFHVTYTGSARGATFALGPDADGAASLFAKDSSSTDFTKCSTAVATERLALQRFYCTLHPWMNGVLVVYDAAVTSAEEVALDPAVLLLQGAAPAA